MRKCLPVFGEVLIYSRLSRRWSFHSWSMFRYDCWPGCLKLPLSRVVWLSNLECRIIFILALDLQTKPKLAQATNAFSLDAQQICTGVYVSFFAGACLAWDPQTEVMKRYEEQWLMRFFLLYTVYCTSIYIQVPHYSLHIHTYSNIFDIYSIYHCFTCAEVSMEASHAPKNARNPIFWGEHEALSQLPVPQGLAESHWEYAKQRGRGIEGTWRSWPDIDDHSHPLSWFWTNVFAKRQTQRSERTWVL